jgi:hypothetical protein
MLRIDEPPCHVGALPARPSWSYFSIAAGEPEENYFPHAAAGPNTAKRHRTMTRLPLVETRQAEYNRGNGWHHVATTEREADDGNGLFYLSRHGRLGGMA